jgi:hypothetical protein
MSKVTVFANTLVLNGHTKTLALAEKHNRRLIAAEIGGYGGIDGRKTHSNLELVKLEGTSFEETALSILRSKGLELAHYSYKKKNRGYAVELVFSVTSGHQCDFNAMYADCLIWLRDYYPECPILHAVVHHDEDTPHMHVILVPLFGGALQADKIRGYKGISRKRNVSLFEFLDKRYGLTFPVYLKGAEKKAGAILAIKAYKRLPEAHIQLRLDQPIVQAMHARPEPFLHALGISYEEVLASMKTSPT